MQLISYPDIDRQAWSRLVEESATGNWFQTPEAYDFYASLPDMYEPFAIAVINDQCPMSNDQCQMTNHLSPLFRGVCVGYVTKEKSRVKNFFSRRLIINGGPCLADDATIDEVYALLSSIINDQLSIINYQSPIYIETRNFNDYSPWKEAFEKAGFMYQPHLNIHVDTRSMEAMKSRISDNRLRQIRRGLQDSHLVVKEAENEAQIGAWYEILKTLYRTKIHKPLPGIEFFLTFYRQQRGIYLLVLYDNKVIGGMMCPILEGRTIYEWYVCGDDAHYKAQNPSVMATWAAMDYAASHHLERFDFMGAGVPDEPYGVRDFKAEFGGTLVEQGRFLHIAHPFLYRLGSLAIRLRPR